MEWKLGALAPALALFCSALAAAARPAVEHWPSLPERRTAAFVGSGLDI